MTWLNYFVTSLYADGATGHIEASTLRDKILKHNGAEAYHCAYDFVKEELVNGSVKDYKGIVRPALGYVWFDFDSNDGGVLAYTDTRAFVKWLGIANAFICFSGNKGFHVGVPFGYFGLDASNTLPSRLTKLAQELKKQFTTLDTTVFNANRKFRALGSRHPKSGLYKITITDLELNLNILRGRAHARQ